MMKKLISLFCCLLPVGALADTIPVLPADGTSVSTSQTDWQNAITAGDSILINSGNGIVSDDGFSIANNIYVGREDQGSQSGDLYIASGAKNNPFTIATNGDVSVGAILHVLDGWQLGVQRYTTDNAFDFVIEDGAVGGSLIIGDTTDGGASVGVTGVGNFIVNGQIIANGDFSVDAGVFSSGSIEQNTGDLIITTTGLTTIAGLNLNSGSANISADAGITSGATVQNTGGVLNLTTNGAVSITGDLDSKGTQTKVVANSLTVSNTIINDENSNITLNAGSLTVGGGTQSSGSFVNKGDMYVTVTGQTYLENGFSLSGMGADNVFRLDTGSLVFGDNVDKTVWAQTFLNSVKNFDLVIRSGDLNLAALDADIVNGADFASGANMIIAANNVSAENISNYGSTLRVVAGAEFTGDLPDVNPLASGIGGTINVENQIVTASGAKTDIVAAESINATGVVNQGNTTLSSASVTLGSVTNSDVGSSLYIKSLTDATGKINITGDVSNSAGLVSINAKDVNVSGRLIGTGGVIDIQGSDTDGNAVNLGGIDVTGGVININALAGDLNIGSVFSVIKNGALNLGTSVENINVASSINIAGDLTASDDAVSGNGDVNIEKTGGMVTISSFFKNPSTGLYTSSIDIGGNVYVDDENFARSLMLQSNNTTVAGNVTVSGKGILKFGKAVEDGVVFTASTDVDGDVRVVDGGQLVLSSDNVNFGSLYSDSLITASDETMYIITDNGDIEIDGNVYMNDEMDTAGLFLNSAAFTLQTTADETSIDVNSVFVGENRTLNLIATDEITIGGVINNSGVIDISADNAVQVDGATVSSDSFTVSGTSVQMGDVTNSGSIKITATDGDVNTGILKSNGGAVDIDATTSVNIDAIEQSAGVMNVDAQELITQSLIVKNYDTQVFLNVESLDVDGNVNIDGDFAQGGTLTKMMNFSGADFDAANLTIGGDLLLVSGSVSYDIGTNVNVSGDVLSEATARFNVGNTFVAKNLTNYGDLTIDAQKGVALQNVVNEFGIMTFDSNNTVLDFAALSINSGNILLKGAGLFVDSGIDTGAMLYQNYTDVLLDKDINIFADTYNITVDNLTVSGINQKGNLTINTDSIDVTGDVVANDLRFVLRKDAEGNPIKDSSGNTAWLSAEIGGNVSGGVDFIGLNKMTIGKNYTFDSNSALNVAVLPYATGAGSSSLNYWSSVSLNNDNTLGEIINAQDGVALVQVGGIFTSGVLYDDNAFTSTENNATELSSGQIGVSLKDAVDQGTAIWLLYADGGVENFSSLELLRNLNVNYCNADGSICYDYLTSLKDENNTDEDLPAYISVRDTNNDGNKDSLYVVFDPRFGGPVLLENMKIQPIVGRVPMHTDGEYVSAGALDDLLLGQVRNKKFFNRTPIEVIPLVFQGTNMEQMANELYNRMEAYAESPHGEGLARFSRLFQVREIEQIVGEIALNEHTTFRSFEDRMFDEFIWNRNRSLKKAWLDVDYGMFYQNIDDGKHTDGNRFSISGGFDWQESDTLVMGLTGRVSHTTSDAHDTMNLGYLPGKSIEGRVDIDVADTSVAFGGYLIKTLGESVRLYGNAFIDLHLFDVDRTQNYVNHIDGDGSALSLISEWGLMHDILNQYVVGNLYARAGYNFGFNVKEKVSGDDYMRLESDGYFVLTPGYSLIAQKRIYPSAWFQMRPYASIGVEYDLGRMPDSAKYKFAPSDGYTDYDIDIDPLWANIGGGIEMLSANGVQVGIDYRYQYNSDIQLHNIKVSGSYRF